MAKARRCRCKSAMTVNVAIVRKAALAVNAVSVRPLVATVATVATAVVTVATAVVTAAASVVDLRKGP